MNITRAQLAGMMDHTLLKPTATEQDILRICDEAKGMGAAAVCINPVHVPLASRVLRESAVRVCTVIGFPLGAHATAIKAAEAKNAVCAGAEEIDMVVNIGAVKSGEKALVTKDISAVIASVGDAPVKVILETCYLTDEEKVWVCERAAQVGAAFVKTSTGFGPSGATAHDVALLRSSVPPAVGVKASGGIRTLADALALLEAGATRLGVSASIAILSELDDSCVSVPKIEDVRR
jgi:deoxyribose-phosphate aldolase